MDLFHDGTERIRKGGELEYKPERPDLTWFGDEGVSADPYSGLQRSVSLFIIFALKKYPWLLQPVLFIRFVFNIR